jgi:hypothetical protein
LHYREVKPMRLVSDQACDILAGVTRPPHIEVASDREAMRMALQEFMVREMFENPYRWLLTVDELVRDAGAAAFEEFKNAPINKGKEPFWDLL